MNDYYATRQSCLHEGIKTMAKTTIFEQMRVAAQSTAQHNASVIKLVTGLTDETVIAKLRYEYLIGTLMGRCGLGDNAAIDYLPAMDAKPGAKGKWSDFPIKAPETFDPAKHRPLAVHHAYRGGLANWSNIRASAGLAPLKTVAPRAPDTAPAASDKPVPVTLESFVVPKECNAAIAAQLVANFDTLLDRTLKAHGDHIVGEAGAIIRQIRKDIHVYVVDLADALAKDQAAPADETAKALEETRAMLATMRAELEAANAAKAAPLAPAKAGRKAKAA